MEVERLPGGERLTDTGRAGRAFFLPPHNLRPLTPSFLSASSKRKKEEAVDLKFLQDHKHLIKNYGSYAPPAHLCASNTTCIKHHVPYSTRGPRPVEGSRADSNRSWLRRSPGSLPSHSTFSLFKITYSKELMCLEIDSLQRLIFGFLFGFYS